MQARKRGPTAKCKTQAGMWTMKTLFARQATQPIRKLSYVDLQLLQEPSRSGAEEMSDRENVTNDLERQKIQPNQEKESSRLNKFDFAGQDFLGNMENSPQQTFDQSNKSGNFLGEFHRNLAQDLDQAPDSHSNWERVKPKMPNFYPNEGLTTTNEDKLSQKSDFEELKFSGFEPLFEQEKTHSQPTLNSPLPKFSEEIKQKHQLNKRHQKPIDINDCNLQQQDDHLTIETYITEDEGNSTVEKREAKPQALSSILDVGGGSAVQMGMGSCLIIDSHNSRQHTRMETQEEISSFDRRMNEDQLYNSDYVESTTNINNTGSQNQRGHQNVQASNFIRLNSFQPHSSTLQNNQFEEEKHSHIDQDTSLNRNVQSMSQHHLTQHPNLLFQPFQQSSSKQSSHFAETQHAQYQNHAGNQNYNDSCGVFGGMNRACSNYDSDPLVESTQTLGSKVNPALTKDDGIIHTPPETSDEEMKQGIVKEDVPTELTEAQRKNYERLVAKVIKESIERENMQLSQIFQNQQLRQQQEQQQLQQQQKRNPFKFQPKNPKIFSKPNFPVSKSFNGRQKKTNQQMNRSQQSQQMGIYRQSNMQQQQQRQNGRINTNTNRLIQLHSDAPDNQRGNTSRSGRPIKQQSTFATEDSIEESEVIEEMIEIEETDDECSNEANNSGTFKTNFAGGRGSMGSPSLAGGKGSMGSIVDHHSTSSGYLQEEQKYNFIRQGGQRSPQAFKTSNKIFLDDRQHSQGGFTGRFANKPTIFNSSVSQAPQQNKQYVNSQVDFEDLEAIFQADHLTEHENDETEQPFYIPGLLESNSKCGIQSRALDFYHQFDKQDNMSIANTSPRLTRNDHDNHSVAAIYNSTHFDLVRSEQEHQNSFSSSRIRANSNLSPAKARARVDNAASEREHRHNDDDDIVNQNSSHDGRSDGYTSIEIGAQEIDMSDRPLMSDRELLRQPGNQEEEKKQQLDEAPSSQLVETRRGPPLATQVQQSCGPQMFSYFSASSLSDDRWLCPICLDIFSDAVETECCNNLFCESCIRQARNCPLCMKQLGHLKPNIPIRRLVLELSITCPNEHCDTVVRRCDMDRHVAECEWTHVECPNNSDECGFIIRKDLKHHLAETCEYRLVDCLLNCGIQLVQNQMDDHIRIDCKKAELQCRNGCGQVVERGLMEHHLNVQCGLQEVKCPNKGESLFEEGCNAIIKRKDLDQHKQVCPFRKIICPNQKCNSVIMYKNLISHDERCLFKIVDCDNKCGARVLRQNHEQHKNTCEYQLVKCPYYDFGCKIEILRKDYMQHLNEANFNHSIIFIEGQKKKNKEIEELKSEIHTLRKDYDSEMQWMYVEMNNMKEEMRKMHKALHQPQAAVKPENDKSIFLINDNSNSFNLNRSRQLSENQPVQQSSIFFAGNQNEAVTNNRHFGGTRYNTGVQSMSVASQSIQNQAHNQNYGFNMNQNRDTGHDVLNQGFMEGSILNENNSPSRLPNQNLHQQYRNQNATQSSLADQERPRTRRGRIGMGRLETEQPVNRFNQGQPVNNITSVLDAKSPDYNMMERQNSLEISHDNFINQQESLSLLQTKNSIPNEENLGGISQVNPLTTISNQNAGAQDLLRIEESQRKSLSSTVLVSFENDRTNNQIESQSQSLDPNSLFNHHKPPLFQVSRGRNSMIQEENSSSNIASSFTVNGASNMRPHGFSGPSVASALSGPSARENNNGMRREGSERKNPLVYFLGSANASVDTQQNQL